MWKIKHWYLLLNSLDVNTGLRGKCMSENMYQALIEQQQEKTDLLNNILDTLGAIKETQRETIEALNKKA